METFIILKYRIISFLNKTRNLDKWKRIKNTIFILSGLILLSFIYLGFLRVLNYLKGIEIIGELLIWKLSAMIFLINFFMIIISSLIISMTTLFYSHDLKFLLSMPIPLKNILTDKIIVTSFYSSWSLTLILIPYIIAMIKTMGYSWKFAIVFLSMIIPYSFLASFIGILIALNLMYLFPSSKTRDIVWLISSISFAVVYMAIRYSKPEKLIKPDAFGIIANYLTYLQTPTAPYLPSWWFTKALMRYANHDYSSFLWYFLIQWLICITVFTFILWLGNIEYLEAFSGAQNTSTKKIRLKKNIEFYIAEKLKRFKDIIMLTFKERKMVLRDVRYYSQTILVFALTMVYIFSIKNIPADDQVAKNFIAFLNIAMSGFVISALCLRFVFTSISFEDGNIWIVKTLPIKASDFIYSKLLFYFSYILVFDLFLIGFSNYYLGIDKTIFSFSIFISVIMTFSISCFAISMGIFFPDFKIENIHYVESSYGGFLFMALALSYTVFSVIWFAYPIKIFFVSKFLNETYFDKFFFYSSIILFTFGSFIASSFLLKRSCKKFENMEVE